MDESEPGEFATDQFPTRGVDPNPEGVFPRANIQTPPPPESPAKYFAKAIATAVLISPLPVLALYKPDVIESMNDKAFIVIVAFTLVCVLAIWLAEAFKAMVEGEYADSNDDEEEEEEEDDEEEVVAAPAPPPTPPKQQYCDICEEWLEPFEQPPLCATCKQRCLHYANVYAQMEKPKTTYDHVAGSENIP